MNLATTVPTVLSSSSIADDEVYNTADEKIGFIKDLMIDLRTGQVRFAVMSFGGFLGMGDKLFAVPFDQLSLDPVNERFLLDVDKQRLENAPGFDQDNWPDFADTSFTDAVTGYYRS